MAFVPDSFRPASVEAGPGGEYRIRWLDGHSSVYTLPYLRAECPCANCREERGKQHGMVMLTGGPPADIHVVDVVPQGNYAVKFTWSDGHEAGIYSFQYLREACPCAQCKAMRPAE